MEISITTLDIYRQAFSMIIRRQYNKKEGSKSLFFGGLYARNIYSPI